MKKNFMLRVSSLAVLGLALVFSSCEQAADVTTPNNSSFAQPQFSSFTIVQGGAFVPGANSAPASTSMIIGSKGGTLYAGDHILTVPARAVPNGTTFRFSVNPSNRFHVTLTATSKNGSLNDVGAAGFNTPVSLHLNFGSAPPAGAQVAWLNNGGNVVPLPSSISGNFVIGKVPHFTELVLIE